MLREEKVNSQQGDTAQYPNGSIWTVVVTRLT